MFFAAILVVRALHVRYGLVYCAARDRHLGVALPLRDRPGRRRPGHGSADVRLRPNRDELERATGLFRLFREQPTPELARSARAGLDASLSFNDRLQQLYHPWTSYLIVPLFAVANAGIQIDGKFLAKAYTSPITLGIILGYVIGKPIGVVGVSLAGDHG